jgi:HD-like signal output (HDOD) protein/ActR/RegA family two-component response regulator
MKRILFVDDDPSVLQGIKRMLHSKRNEWEIAFAPGAEEALRLFEQKEFDVVVSDIRMPGMDGATLLAKIKEHYPGAARIILSGYSEADVAIRATASAHQFLAKPCDPKELVSAVDRVCNVQGFTLDAEVRRVVGQIGQLPSLPRAYVALREAVENPDTSIATVVEIVETDIAMVAKILQLVNSAFFGLARPITSLHGAVNYLGLNTIRNLALMAEAFRVFTPGAGIPGSLYDQTREHGQRSAEIAARLPLGPAMRDLTIVACLLQDVGTLVLASKLPHAFLSACSIVDKRGCQMFEAEEEVLGTSHAEVGAYLLGLWGIPQSIAEAVAHHHRPTRISHSGLDTCTAVYTAAVVARQPRAAKSSECELSEYDRNCFHELGLLERLPEFFRASLEEV